MAIFNSYVSLPEGKWVIPFPCLMTPEGLTFFWLTSQSSAAAILNCMKGSGVMPMSVSSRIKRLKATFAANIWGLLRSKFKSFKRCLCFIRFKLWEKSHRHQTLILVMAKNSDPSWKTLGTDDRLIPVADHNRPLSPQKRWLYNGGFNRFAR